MLRVVESDKLSGSTAWARCDRLRLASGDTVRLVVAGHEEARVYVTLREGVVFENVLAVSPSVWSRLHDLTGSGHIEAEPVPLSFADVLRRKLTRAHVAGVLALMAAALMLALVVATALTGPSASVVVTVVTVGTVGAALGIAAFVIAWRGPDRIG
ncbi:hypothetical protein Lesp02_45980 [Lentzea sp. NBRC 105346]|uniref:hypothetical protein n=1 Tax=Lentzea sp. NBRC 105346 TaxID=3032205 RepID=UPI0024A0E0B8|nr:hypothetical protein [Lentzea sp. NBRC 105346]GLZ32410.1 hypothetical protein Lesp02_45980 [Lentzea sp. NBRC 105346]